MKIQMFKRVVPTRFLNDPIPQNGELNNTKLIDSDFEVYLTVTDGNDWTESAVDVDINNVGDGFALDAGVGVAIEVAKEYEKRGLDVISNLVLYFKYITDSGFNYYDIAHLNYKNYPELSKEFYEKYGAALRRHF